MSVLLGILGGVIVATMAALRIANRHLHWQRSREEERAVLAARRAAEMTLRKSGASP